MLSRRWVVSFHVRASKGARSTRMSGFVLPVVTGGAGRVIEVSMLAG